MIHVHITADSDFWTGASTRALLAARAHGADAVVITGGDADMAARIEAAGVKAVRCPMNGIFASLNLSRALRRIEGDEFRVCVYSPSVLPKVEGALRLVGRKEPMTLVNPAPQPEFPPVSVEHPAEGSEPLIMWLGNITPDCGLAELIEELAARSAAPWRLRVVGQGKGRVVSPILRRCRALGIADRIEWVGYSVNPYEQMNGVSAGIITAPRPEESTAALEFAAASIPVITKLSQILP